MTRTARIAFTIVPIVAAGLATLTLAANPTASRGAPAPELSDGRVQRGFELAPVRLDLRGKNRALVGVGSYIVNAQGACNDCHTCPSFAEGGDPYVGQEEQVNAANYLAGGTPFGPFISKNITPDEHGKPAGLDRGEFIELMRTGHDPDAPGVILQVMPWPVYGKMVERDLLAVYEYLSAIPHAEPSAACGGPER